MGQTALPERAPWNPLDILEWQDLKPHRRYLDLKTYAMASDRCAGRKPHPHPERIAA